MNAPPPGRRRRIALVLGWLAVSCAALAIWAQLTEGFRVYVLGVPISVRGELRPALAALVLGIASLHLYDAWHSPAFVRAVRAAPRLIPWIAAGLAVWTTAVALMYGTRTAGGADASGYVSQAELWLKGDLKVPQPAVGPLPWPGADWTFSPLGYRPTADRAYLVPTYAPGLPLLMAAARVIAGTCGPYLVAPLCAGLMVWATYAIGLRLADRVVGLIAAAALAASPTFLFMMLQPMSDVPNAAFWTFALLFAGRSKPHDALIAGTMTGIAIVIRPNLAPLAAVPALLTLWASDRDGSHSMVRRALLFGAGCAPFVLLVAAIFDHLYGSPFTSGYGSLDETYSLENAPLTLSRYPRWFLESQGLFAFTFLLTPIVVWLAPASGRVPRLLYFFFILAVVALYVFYTAFEEWWYLRFLLAAFPFVFILGFDAVGVLTARYGRVIRGMALVIVGGFVIATGASEADARDVVGQGDGERRYADAARHVTTHLPPGAVVVSMQHSGSLNLYTDTLPLRYDLVAPEWMDRAIALLRERGRPVYLLLDDWEVPRFAETFRGQNTGTLVAAAPLAVTADGRVLLFGTEGGARDISPVVMPGTHGCLPPAD